MCYTVSVIIHSSHMEEKCKTCGADVVNGQCSVEQSHDISGPTPVPETQAPEVPQE